MLKISIVTVTFNNVKTIEKTIQSILDQKYPNLDYIVIDGGSTDGTLKILDKYKSYFSYFQSSHDKGVFDAMNKGIAKASGDIIGFVNGDDFLYKNILHKAYDLFNNRINEKFFSAGDIDYIDDENNIVGSKFHRKTPEMLKRRFLEMPTNHLCIFLPLEVFNKYGLFDIKYPYRADYLYILNLIKEGYRPIFFDTKVGGFRLGGQSGGYKAFFENYSIVKKVSNNLLLAFYSTFLAISKLFFQRNLPTIYNTVAKIYYIFNKNLNRKEILTPKKKIIEIVDTSTGGGAEKLVYFLQKNLNVVQNVIVLFNYRNNTISSEKYKFLNIKTNSKFLILKIIINFFKIIYHVKNKKNIYFHSHLSKSFYVTCFFSILFKIPHIHTEHNTHNRRREKWYLYPIEILAYSSLKNIICISEATRYELLSYMPYLNFDKIKVIKNGTRLFKYKKRNFLGKKKFNLIYVGSLTYKKGLDLFLESLPSVRDKINSVKIIGSGPEKDNLIYIKKKLSLDNLVDFVEYTENIEDFIYEADIGILPSRWEGFGLAAVEMLSSGLPIMISDTAGLGDIFSKYNGVVTFKNGSLNSLKISLNKIIDELKENKLILNDINDELEEYDENNFISKYNHFYQKL